MMFRRSLVGVLALAAGLPAAARAHTDHGETDYGKPGDPKKPARIVQVVMREADGRMLFVPDRDHGDSLPSQNVQARSKFIGRQATFFEITP